MSYAVFDWDNTVREGFTLFQWTDYLCRKGTLPGQLGVDLEDSSIRYQNGEISHDDYAEKACAVYAMYLTGLKANQFREILPTYMEEDRQKIFPYVGGTMKFLNDNDIDIIVISGSPEIVLNQYKDRYNIRTVYAMASEAIGDVYTGKVLHNYGCKKKEVVALLVAEYGEPPLFGFGDSDSDIPLLTSARWGIRIVSKKTRLKLDENRLTVFPNDVSAETVIEDLEKKLSMRD